MKVAGTRIITLSREEVEILRGASRVLSDLAEEIDSTGEDGDFVMELNRAYDTCVEASQKIRFEYTISEG